MSEYQLELKQIVDYPRCRIYRQFIQTLMADRSIRASGGSGLFHFTVLCSYANFRTSYRNIDGIGYTVYPGEWVCRVSELAAWFRVRFHYQAVSILEKLQKQHLITYSTLGRGKVVKFKIKGWRRHNTVLDYNAPCQKDSGFFFMPIAAAAEIISSEKCSEMDCVLDLWLNAIYNDEQVKGSDIGPVVYMRNGTGSPLLGYAELAERWGISKATVGRFLKRMEAAGYLSLMSFPGTHGSVIYLQNYLSTMFQISDVMIDKDEVAMTLNIKIVLPEKDCIEAADSVSKTNSGVSNAAMETLVEKVAQILTTQGFSCFGCPKSTYKLYPLSDDCREAIMSSQPFREGTPQAERYRLAVSCGDMEIFHFELTLTPTGRFDRRA
ncbi:helix-turn-helix domain-containing protein [Sporomusa sphaeroides]|uniref:helix-turn-helix domain-containing protein n=1 Tax=Sporomusa sphaeroides TaxID=47679 RepID=UPI002CF1C0F9|nr:helix-turn-helix domain-containing protein [Sporomusa sphaeroides]HML33416.1 helix-turn-helix domain-containing protein [Sporomusa sphaeroides]